ncbi:MAG: biopolymer transporter ExbD [Prevotella sp.]|jgi:biopolymer transport protein ExbD|nr:biopolymer transporter ExbD [Prevotella sp.]MBQ6033588.1 biopolymer transporter ExbD [Prevotella sp.]MBQ6309572.1 biopolymer transporter ExbD [Prevotella sp.]MBQ6659218.1 biopolymer transporter ExbD [Prevotella sp.]MBQ7716325.1 biopolymer transporter ExbD [Prevotella sp.]
MAKKKQSRQKKMNTRVDFTPMVDMMMLLITFFMLCTSLAKPQTMNLTMPSNDKNISDQDRNAAKASQTITMFVCGNDKIYYVEGIPNYDDPTCLKETTWGKNGIRDVLIKHVTEDGFTPVADIMAAKIKLDQKKLENPMQYPDSIYDKELAKIKKGELETGKIPTMTIIIKCTDEASYKNMVDALDEMTICSIGTYVIDKINDDDLKLLEKRGVK